MALSELTLGSNATVQGALWAGLYGTEHLGAIRALVTAVVVFASALSPALIGILIDAGVALEAQLLTMAACCPIAALWMGALLPRLDRLATTWACGQRCGSRGYPPAHTACEVATFSLRISLSAGNGQRIYWRTAGAAGSFT